MSVSTERHAAPPASIAARDRGGIEVRADQALRGAGLLHFGDHSGQVERTLGAQGLRETARFGLRQRGFAHGVQRALRAAFGDLDRLAREDGLQHVAHVSPSSACRRRARHAPRATRNGSYQCLRP
jgi:hypothetical protein